MNDPGRRSDGASAAEQGLPRRSRSFGDLLPRVLSGVVMIGVATATAIVGGIWFALLWWAASVAILWEWQSMIGGPRLGARVAAGTAALSAASVLIVSGQSLASVACILMGALAIGVLDGSRHLWLAGSGACYAGALIFALDLLRGSETFGLEAMEFLFAVVWTTDIMAYFGGRLVGGPKLWRRISPSKTWAGFLIGVSCGGVAAWAVAPATGSGAIPLFLGMLTGAIAQGGDLFESSFKRRFNTKDSSRLIPGHGGVMDRLDGFLAAAAFAASLGIARYGVEAPGAGLFRW